tara:strand:+ start:496 stop:1641 length:1146 start_codon:yes stop_codon:yes gene_type:complete
MLSNKIYKHFFIELSKYFFVVLFTFSAIVWAVQAVNYLDLIVDDGHAVSIYLGYSLLNISKIFTKFIPLSFLLALFLTILKFEDESEFMILWTAGLNKIRVVNFFLVVSLLVTFIQIFFAGFVNPEVLNHSRSLIRSSNIDFISSMIKTNQFNDTVEGLTIYVQEKDENDIMKNIFIRDDNKVLKGLETSKDSGSLTIFAKKGRIEKKDRNYLSLENGTIQTQNKNNEITSINFKKTSLLLKGMKTKSIVQPKLQETSSLILFECLFKKNLKKKLLNCAERSKLDALSEFNRRLGMPLYIPYVALLSCFLLIGRDQSKRKSLYKYFYFALGFLTLVMAEILVRYSGKSLFYSTIYYLIPIISVPILYLILFRKFYFENLRR